MILVLQAGVHSKVAMPWFLLVLGPYKNGQTSPVTHLEQVVQVPFTRYRLQFSWVGQLLDVDHGLQVPDSGKIHFDF